MKGVGEVPNMYVGNLRGSFDGIKMDIEGSEFGILDSGLLPPSKKLCFEYHTSRDQSMGRLRKRLDVLERKFEVVNYPPELDQLMELGGNQKSFHDRVIWCMNPKKKRVRKKKARS